MIEVLRTCGVEQALMCFTGAVLWCLLVPSFP